MLALEPGVYKCISNIALTTGYRLEFRRANYFFAVSEGTEDEIFVPQKHFSSIFAAVKFLSLEMYIMEFLSIIYFI